MQSRNSVKSIAQIKTFFKLESRFHAQVALLFVVACGGNTQCPDGFVNVGSSCAQESEYTSDLVCPVGAECGACDPKCDEGYACSPSTNQCVALNSTWESESLGTVYGSALDSMGNGYIAGSFNYVALDDTSGESDIAIAFDETGSIRWKLSVSGSRVWPNGSITLANDIIADESNGLVYITGVYSGENVDFRTTTNDVYLTPSTPNGTQPTEDIFVACLAATTGQLQWFSTYGTELSDRGSKLALDSSGNLFLLGLFEGTMTMNDVSITSPVSDPDIYGPRPFLASFDSSGKVIDAKAFLGGTQFSSYALSVDESEQIYLLGRGYEKAVFENIDIDIGSESFGSYIVNSAKPSRPCGVDRLKMSICKTRFTMPTTFSF
ncbi:MAG: hypothetical protein IPJ88_04620 [Myxococcales bacterium]|nr:MAG: hypothetical protein IPJ88_04620 [Myxococcales bacterium]